ncbi:FAD-binding oxidoreductase, partial [Burkholderia cepacia]|nr:FAD-binding oxidoreductase [Burkholderia cepacia]
MSFTYDERIDGPLATVGRDTLVAALHAAAPGLDVLHEREALKPFECDGLAAYRTVPLAV